MAYPSYVPSPGDPSICDYPATGAPPTFTNAPPPVLPGVSYLVCDS